MHNHVILEMLVSQRLPDFAVMSLHGQVTDESSYKIELGNLRMIVQ